MAKDLAVFEEATAKDIVQTIAAIRAKGLLGSQSSEVKQGYAGDQVWNTPAPTIVYNDSGQIVPAYGLMQITATLDEDGRNYVKIKRPVDATTMRCPLLINGSTAIAIGGYGVAQDGPVYKLLHDGGVYIPGDRLGAKTSAFESTLGAMFSVVGADNTLGTSPTDPKIVKVMFDVSSMDAITIDAISPGTPGEVQSYRSDGSLGAIYQADTRVGEIEADSPVQLFSRYGRWLALEIC